MKGDFKKFKTAEIMLFTSIKGVHKSHSDTNINSEISREIFYHSTLNFQDTSKRNIHIFDGSQTLVKEFVKAIARSAEPGSRIGFWDKIFGPARKVFNNAVIRVGERSERLDIRFDAEKIDYLKKLEGQGVITIFLDHNDYNIMKAASSNVAVFPCRHVENEGKLAITDEHLINARDFLNLLQKLRNVVDANDKEENHLAKIEQIILKEETANYITYFNLFNCLPESIGKALLAKRASDKNDIYHKFIDFYLKALEVTYQTKDQSMNGYHLALTMGSCKLVRNMLLGLENVDNVAYYSALSTALIKLPKKRLDAFREYNPELDKYLRTYFLGYDARIKELEKGEDNQLFLHKPNHTIESHKQDESEHKADFRDVGIFRRIYRNKTLLILGALNGTCITSFVFGMLFEYYSPVKELFRYASTEIVLTCILCTGFLAGGFVTSLIVGGIEIKEAMKPLEAKISYVPSNEVIKDLTSSDPSKSRSPTIVRSPNVSPLNKGEVYI